MRNLFTFLAVSFLILSTLSKVEAQAVGISGVVEEGGDQIIDIGQSTQLKVLFNYTGSADVPAGEMFLNIGIPLQVNVGTIQSITGSLTNYFGTFSLVTDQTGHTLSAFNSTPITFNDAGELFITIVGAVSTNGNVANVSLNVSPVNNTDFSSASNLTGFQVSMVSLPVEYISFTTKQADCGEIILNWETGVEINNDRFEIERSDNQGRSFEIIGQVGGKNEGASYQFEDKTVRGSGNYYYRLKQIDFNGINSYSNIERINYTCDEEFSFRLFPNPVDAYLNIETEGNEDISSIEVVDAKGRIVAKQVLRGDSRAKIAVENLQPGAYVLKIINKNVIHHRQFIKL